MPGLEEVRSYLTGLWLLLKQEPAGFRYLDLSDRGALRSFWAMAYAGPAILVSWFWWRSTYLAGMPSGAKAGGGFFFRLAMIEVANWIVPLVLVGLLTWALGIGSRFSGIVSVVNWVAVPLSYAYAVLIVVMFLIPALSGLVTMLWLVLMIVVIAAYFRVIRMICDGHSLTAATLTMVLLIPTIAFSEFLERFLGVYPG